MHAGSRETRQSAESIIRVTARESEDSQHVRELRVENSDITFFIRNFSTIAVKMTSAHAQKYSGRYPMRILCSKTRRYCGSFAAAANHS